MKVKVFISISKSTQYPIYAHLIHVRANVNNDPLLGIVKPLQEGEEVGQGVRFVPHLVVTC